MGRTEMCGWCTYRNMSHKADWTQEAKRLRETGVSYRAIGTLVSKSTMRVWSVLNSERREEHQERWLEKRPGYKQDRERARKEERPDYKAHKATYARERRANHPEVKARERKRCAQYNRDHADRRAAYRKSRLPEIAADASKRRAQKRSLTVPGMEKEIRVIYRQAKENKRIRCYLCGKMIPMGERHVDHIVPLSKGGLHAPRNLAIACAFCNESKGAKLPAEVGVLL